MGGVKPFTATMNAIRIVKTEDVPAEWSLNTYGALSQNTASSYNSSVEDTINGGCFAVGHMFYVPSNSTEGLIVKYDSDMNVTNSKRVLGDNDTSRVSLYSVIEDGSGGCIVVGSTVRSGGSIEALLLSFNSDLTITNTRIIGDTGSMVTGIDRFRGLIKDGENFVTVGTHGRSEYANDQKMFILRFSPDLTIVDEKEVSYGSENLSLYDIVSDGQGGFVAVGDIENLSRGSMIIKLNSSLVITEAKALGGQNGRLIFKRIESDGQGNYVVVGSETIYSNTNNDVIYKGFIAKFDTNLNVLDRKTYAENESTGMALTGITRVGSKFVTVGGTSERMNDVTKPSAYLVIFDSNLSIDSAVKLEGARGDFLYDVKSNGASIYAAGWLTHTTGRSAQASLLKLSGGIAGLSGSLENHELTWSQVTFQSITSTMSLSDKPYYTADVYFTTSNPTFFTAPPGEDYSELNSSSI